MDYKLLALISFVTSLLFSHSYVEVLNEQSYPEVGGEWNVTFKTSGKGELVISAVNGTFYGRDLEPLELRCGEEQRSFAFDGKDVIVKDWECDAPASWVTRVLTPGQHIQKFLFRGKEAYAKNFASVAGSSAKLGAWDLSDNQIVYANYSKIFANYTDLSGNALQSSSIYCEFQHNKTGAWSQAVKMYYNYTSNLYELVADGSYLENHTDYLPVGEYYFKVSCYDASGTYDNLSITDFINVSEYPTEMSIDVDNGKSVGERILFNVSWRSFGKSISYYLYHSDIAYNSISSIDCAKEGRKSCILVGDVSGFNVIYPNGSAYWRGSISYPPFEVFDEDIDGDSYLDVFITYKYKSLDVYDAYGNILQGWTYSYDIKKVSLGDFDKEGVNNDFVVGFFSSSSPSYFIVYNASFPSTSWNELWNLTNPNGLYYVTNIDSCDCDRDGYEDDIIVSLSDGYTYIYEGDTHSMICNISKSKFGSVVDANGDGFRDEIFFTGWGSASMYRWNGVSCENVYNLSYSYSAKNIKTSVDWNRDGIREELVFPASADIINLPFYIYVYNGSSGSQLEYYVSDKPFQADINNYEVKDINGDGILDVVVIAADNSDYDVVIYLSNVTFYYNSFFRGGIVDLVVEDINGDGLRDVSIIKGWNPLYVFNIPLSCALNITNTSQIYDLEWNETTQTWQKTLTFLAPGTYHYTITCEKGGYQDQFDEGYFEVKPFDFNVTPSYAYANYTRIIADFEDADANCSVKFNASDYWSQEYEMVYNASLSAYEVIADGGYLKGHMRNLPPGTYYLNVSCTNYLGEQVSKLKQITIHDYPTTLASTVTDNKTIGERVYFTANYSAMMPISGIGLNRSEIGLFVWQVGDFDADNNTLSLAFVDMQKDGYLNDLIVSHPSSVYENYLDYIDFYYNDGSYNDSYIVILPVKKFIVYDFDNDGFKDEILYATVDDLYTSEVKLIDINKNQYFYFDGDGATLYFSIGNFDNQIYDNDFVILTSGRKILVYNSTNGTYFMQLWNVTVGDGGWGGGSYVNLFDYTNDGIDDIITYYGFGHAYIADGKNGSRIWEVDTPSYYTRSDLIDLDKDGQVDDLVMGQVGYSDYYALHFFIWNGTYNYSTSTSNTDLTYIARYTVYKILDGNNDGYVNDILYSPSVSPPKLRMYDVNSSTILWEYTYPYASKTYFKVLKEGDLLNTNEDLVLVYSSTDGYVLYFDKLTGTLRGRYYINPNKYGDIKGNEYAVDLGYVNHDGLLDVAIAQKNGYLTILQPVTCKITINNTWTYDMFWNPDTYLWEFNKTFLQPGYYTYNITCEKNGYQTQTDSGSFTVQPLYITHEPEHAYANYSRFKVNFHESDANCSLRFNASGYWTAWYPLAFNSTLGLWDVIADNGYLQEHMRSMPPGTYHVQVKCENYIGEAVNTTREITIYDYPTTISSSVTDNRTIGERVFFTANYSAPGMHISGIGLNRSEIGLYVWQVGPLPPGEDTYSISLLDLDHDGRRDEFYLYEYDKYYAVDERGIQLFSFGPLTWYFAARYPFSADLDGDGFIDEVGVGTWSVAYSRYFAFYNESGELTDVVRYYYDEENVNTLGTLVSISSNSSYVGMVEGRSNATVTLVNFTQGYVDSIIWQNNLSSTGRPIYIHHADLNSDNHNDIVFSTTGGGRVFVLDGTNGSIMWNITTVWNSYFVFLDSDKDGKFTDIVVNSNRFNNYYFMYSFKWNNFYYLNVTSSNALYSFSTGPVGVTSHPMYTLYYPSAGELGDKFISIYYSHPVKIALFNFSFYKFWDYQNWDINSDDGDMILGDLITLGYPQAIILVYHNGLDEIAVIDIFNGTLLANYSFDTSYLGSMEWRGMKISDINHDGLNDLAIASYNGYLTILQPTTCKITINNTWTYDMIWNPDTYLWEFNKTFLQPGYYTYNITCEKNGYQTQTSAGSFTVQSLYITHEPEHAYANYSRFKVNFHESDANCSLRFNASGYWTAWYPLAFNSTLGLWDVIADNGYLQEHMRSMPPGTYHVQVKCENYKGEEVNATREITIHNYTAALEVFDSELDEEQHPLSNTKLIYEYNFENHTAIFYANYTAPGMKISGIGLNRSEIGLYVWQLENIGSENKMLRLLDYYHEGYLDQILIENKDNVGYYLYVYDRDGIYLNKYYAYNPSYFIVYDADGDGYLDEFVSRAGTDPQSILVFNTSGLIYDIPSPDSTTHVRVVYSIVNYDGENISNDIIALYTKPYSVTDYLVLYNFSQFPFNYSLLYDSDLSAYADDGNIVCFYTTNIDNDLIGDVYLVHSYGHGYTALGNNGTRLFSFYLGSYPLSCDLFDADGDIKNEFIIGHTDNYIYLFKWNGSYNYSSSYLSRVYLPNDVRDVKSLDIDDDNIHNDLVAVPLSASGFSIYAYHYNQTTNSFESLWSYVDTDTSLYYTGYRNALKISDLLSLGEEQVISYDGKHIIVLNKRSGALLYKHALFLPLMLDYHSVVYDINKDGLYDLVFTDESGSITALQPTTCKLHLNNSQTYDMIWDEDLKLWKYEANLSAGAYEWWITCSKNGYDPQTSPTKTMIVHVPTNLTHTYEQAFNATIATFNLTAFYGRRDHIHEAELLDTNFLNGEYYNNTIVSAGDLSINLTGGLTASYQATLDSERTSFLDTLSWEETLSSLPQPRDVASLNPVLWFHLDNNSAYGENDTIIYDFSGNGNNGTAYGAIPNMTFGRFNGSFYFDGVNDYIGVLSSTSLQINGNLTISIWIYPTNLNLGNYRQTLIGKEPNLEYNLHLVDGTGQVCFSHGDWSSEERICSNIYVKEGEWQSLTVVRDDSAKLLYFYYNGYLKDIKSYTKDVSTSNNNVYLGVQSGTNYRQYQGYIDELIIFNKALTDEEVKKLYYAGLIKFYTRACHLGNCSEWKGPFIYPEKAKNLDQYGRYMQYKVDLEAEPGYPSPVLHNVTLTYKYHEDLNAEIFLNLTNVDNQSIYATRTCFSSPCQLKVAVGKGGEIIAGNYSVYLQAKNSSAYLVPKNYTFYTYIEENEPVFTFHVDDYVIRGYEANTDVVVYVNATFNNTYHATIHNPQVWYTGTATQVKDVQLVKGCGDIPPNEWCNFTFAVTFNSAGEGYYSLYWAYSYDTNNGSHYIINDSLTNPSLKSYIIVPTNPSMNISLHEINITENISSTHTFTLFINNTGTVDLIPVSIKVNNLSQDWFYFHSYKGDAEGVWNGPPNNYFDFIKVVQKYEDLEINISVTNFTKGTYIGTIDIIGTAGTIDLVETINVSIFINPVLQSPDLIYEVRDHNTTTNTSITIASVGNAKVVNIHAACESNPEVCSWLSFNSSIGNLTEHHSFTLPINITIPVHQPPGNYSCLITFYSENHPPISTNLTIYVQPDGSWVWEPVSSIITHSFHLTQPGIIGNLTIKNIGNIPLNFTILYDETITPSDSCENDFQPPFPATPSCLDENDDGANPSYLYILPNQTLNISIKQKGDDIIHTNVGIKITLYEPNANPLSHDFYAYFNITDEPPVILKLTTRVNDIEQNYVELNQPIELYAEVGEDSATGLNESSYAMFNVTFGAWKQNYTPTYQIIYTEYAASARYTYLFTNTSQPGTYILDFEVIDNTNHYNHSQTTFYVISSTSLDLIQEATPHADNISYLWGQTVDLPFTINNTGLVTAYNITITAQNLPVGWSSSTITLSSLSSYQSYSDLLPINVPAATTPAAYSFELNATWQNPDGSWHSIAETYYLIVDENHYFEFDDIQEGDIYEVQHGTSRIINFSVLSLGNDPANVYLTITSQASNIHFQYSVDQITWVSAGSTLLLSNIPQSTSKTVYVNISVDMYTSPITEPFTISAYSDTQSSSLTANVKVPFNYDWIANATNLTINAVANENKVNRDIAITSYANVPLEFNITMYDLDFIQPPSNLIYIYPGETYAIPLNYTAPDANGQYNGTLRIYETTSSQEHNVSIQFNSFKFELTILNITPSQNVIAGNLVTFDLQLIYGSQYITDNLTYEIYINDSQCITYSQYVVGNITRVMCFAPIVLDNYYHDVKALAYHNTSYGEVIIEAVNHSAIHYKDVTPPWFVYSEEDDVALGNNGRVYVEAADNGDITSLDITIHKPDGNISTYNVLPYDISNGIYYFEKIISYLDLEQVGEYNVSYALHDAEGNTNSSYQRMFEVYVLNNYTGRIADIYGNAIETTMHFYHPYLKYKYYDIQTINGYYLKEMRMRPYLVNFTFLDYELWIYDADLSNITYQFINFDTPAPAEFGYAGAVVKGFAINTTFRGKGNLTVIYNLDEVADLNLDYLRIVKCSDWDYQTRTCNGYFEELATSIDKVAHKLWSNIYINEPHAAYFVAQVEIVPQPDLEITDPPTTITVQHGTQGVSGIGIASAGQLALEDISFECVSGSYLCDHFAVTSPSIPYLAVQSAITNHPIYVKVPFGTPPGTYTGTIRVTSNLDSDYPQQEETTLTVIVPVNNTLLYHDYSPTTITTGSLVSESIGSIEVKSLANVNKTLVYYSSLPYIQSKNNTLITPGTVINYSVDVAAPAEPNIYYIDYNLNNEFLKQYVVIVAYYANITDVTPDKDIVAGDLLTIYANVYDNGVEQLNVSWEVTIEGKKCEIQTANYLTDTHVILCNAPQQDKEELVYDLKVKATWGGNRVAYAVYPVKYKDVFGPTLLDYEKEELKKDTNATISFQAEDLNNISSVSAVIYTPSNQTIIIENYTESLDEFNQYTNIIYHEPATYDYVIKVPLEDIGDYTVKLVLTDNSSYLNNATYLFKYELFEYYYLLGSLTDPLKPTPYYATIKAYYPGEKTPRVIAYTNASNGYYNVTLHKRVYDIELDILNHTLFFKNIDVSKLRDFIKVRYVDPPSIFALPDGASPVTGIAVNFTYNGTLQGYIKMRYDISQTRYGNYLLIKMYKCEDWVFENDTCNGEWLILNSTPSYNQVFAEINSFSAYALGETLPPRTVEVNVNLPTTTGGGGGGGASIGEIAEVLNKSTEYLKEKLESINPLGDNLLLDTEEVKVDLYVGEHISTQIRLFNAKNQTEIVSANLTPQLYDFITIRPVQMKIEGKKERFINLDIYGNLSYGEGIYTGYLYLNLQNAKVVKRIPVRIRLIESTLKMPKLSIKPIANYITPGSKLKVRFEVLNIERIRNNYTVLIELKDVVTNKIIAALSKEYPTSVTNDVVELTVPEGIKIGEYIVEGTLFYERGSYSVKYSTAEPITVRKPIMGMVKDALNLVIFAGLRVWHVILALFILATAYESWKYYQRYLEKKRRYHLPIYPETLPKAGPNVAYLGLVAERNIKAFLEFDKLKTHTIVAGATGGGKTVAAQVIVEEALKKGITVFVFDPTAQWSGFLKPNTDKDMLKKYPKFGLSPKAARGFKGNIHHVVNARQKLNFKKYMNEKGIHVFTLNQLTDLRDMDIFVANAIREVFKANLDESKDLRVLLVFDEVHRLLPKFGGSGDGFIQIERACREFRKWGVGLILISQVLSDFVGEIRANINTEIQMRTRDEGDLERIKNKYGEEILHAVVKAEVGTGMFENPAYNRGIPYMISFRPLLHSPQRLSDEELNKYKKYNDEIEDIEWQIEQLKQEKVDTFELELELKLAKNKLMEGNFNMVEIYLQGLRPMLESAWVRIGKQPKKRELELVSEEELRKEVEIAKKMREKYSKVEQDINQLFKDAKDLEQKVRELRAKGKDMALFESQLKTLQGELKLLKLNQDEKELERLKKKVDDLKKELEKVAKGD